MSKTDKTATAKPSTKPLANPPNPPKTSKAPAAKIVAKKVVPKKVPAKPKAVAKKAVAIKRVPSGKPNATTPGTKRNKPMDIGELFAHEYMIDFNAKQAYLRVRPRVKAGTAEVEGSRLLGTPQVSALIEELKAKRIAAVDIKAEEVARHFKALAFMDHRKLVQSWQVCCRYCWGERHLYQRTDGEFEEEEADHTAKEDAKVEANAKYRPKAFRRKGGPGFDVRRSPNTECPRCGGAGETRIVPTDTRQLSEDAAILYAGAKEGKDGLEIKLHDKAAALVALAKHVGFFEADNRQKGTELTPDALRLFVDRMDAARERQAKVREERNTSGFTGD